MKIIIELDKGVDKNASMYFEKSKKLKKKIEGVKKAIINAEEKLKKEKEKEKNILESDEKKEIEKNRKKEWYEKFRWFISTDDFLVIGGKDASSNESVIKKHTEPQDLVYHSEAPGSPFVVIKNPDSKEIPKSTKLEAATLAATFSRAWNLGLRTAEVFEVLPNQVTKEAKSGEFVPKGGFMIYGKRTEYNSSLELGIGILDQSEHKIVMSGPLSAVKKHCKKYTILRQGDLKKGEISKKLMKLFNLHTNDDIISALPSGKFNIAKE